MATAQSLIESSPYELAMKLRKDREPMRNPGRPASPESLLAGLLRCGRCGASYQLETSGKCVNSAVYRYRYYNCRTFCRVGSTACAGGRIPVAELDAAVLEHIAALVCSEERCDALLLEMNGRDRTRSASCLVVDGHGRRNGEPQLPSPSHRANRVEGE
jgi:hypothetical protein